MVSCKTVAKETQIRYGSCIHVIHFAYGNIAIIAQTIVPRTSNISMLANGKFLIPNCIQVNKALKTIFSINGKSTTKGTFFSKNILKTAPKEIAMSKYSTLQTGPNSHDGGAHVGFMSSE